MAEPSPSPGDATAHFAASAVGWNYFSSENMLTDVWTGESLEGSVVQPLRMGTHRLSQDGGNIVKYCERRPNDKEREDCAVGRLACHTCGHPCCAGFPFFPT